MYTLQKYTYKKYTLKKISELTLEIEIWDDTHLQRRRKPLKTDHNIIHIKIFLLYFDKMFKIHVEYEISCKQMKILCVGKLKSGVNVFLWRLGGGIQTNPKIF